MKHSPISFLAGALLVFFSANSLRADEEGPEFLHDFDEAVSAAEEAGKPTILIFSASWCPPCQQMKKAVYPSEAVKPYHDKFVWAYLDADDPKNGPVSQEYGVSGIPHIVFLKPDAEPIGYFSGAIPPEDFVKVLDKALAATGETEEKSEVSAATQ